MTEISGAEVIKGVLPLEDFEEAFWQALKSHGWVVGLEEARKWLSFYIDGIYGHPSYSWTRSDAEEIAREYVSEFGNQDV